MCVRPSRSLRKAVAAVEGLKQQRPQPREPDMEGSKPIIIIKKKVAHGGHHGGAWKVAYAVFVTAMMALFIVLWLLNPSKPVREAIAGYFKDPSGTAGKLGTTVEGKGEVVVAPKKEDMEKLKQELEKAISQMPDFDKLKNQ